YQKLWQPIEQAIGNCERLYVLPDGILYQINLETIWQAEQASYLKDMLDIQRINHITDLFLELGDHNANSPILIGDPDFGPSGEIAPLAGTKLEVETIERLLSQKGEVSQVYLGKAASKKNILSVNQPRLLHIATHGYYEKPSSEESSISGASFQAANKNPYLQAGLLLEGAAKGKEEGWGSHPGILTAMEAANLNLFNTELVVLSACSSGLGQMQSGEGVYGLARAFREAGAQKVMYSLWPVADKATADLMKYFYQFWLAGNTVDEAFSQAQDRLREQYPEPVYWGAFLLV
ncbi:MAG: CHAT domain-containing protein, partial [Bacteroidota bacterium]